MGQLRRLLICADWFAPGFRAGGPIRSVVNLTHLLTDHADVQVLTGCRDLGETQTYAGVSVNQWVHRNKNTSVFYGTAWARHCEFFRLVRKDPPAAVYLNSMFSWIGAIWPLLVLLLWQRDVPVVVAPRGMLKPSALYRKFWKKGPVLRFLRGLGLTQRVVFHATSQDEVAEIQQQFPGARVVLVPNVPQWPVEVLPERGIDDGVLRLVLVGRIHPIKNVHLAIESLRGLSVPCELVLVGPAEDAAYELRCRQLAAELGGAARVIFAGALDERAVREQLIRADALILPTQGENFGHAIFESFSVGTPVIISDCTIWRDLADKQAGWDLPLGDPAAFTRAVRALSSTGPEARQRLREGALGVARAFVSQQNFLADYKRLFRLP
ncbi:MAG: glycosyltransferase family 4 protein [Planctomycetaceae bacterium]